MPDLNVYVDIDDLLAACRHDEDVVAQWLRDGGTYLVLESPYDLLSDRQYNDDVCDRAYELGMTFPEDR